MPFALKMGDLHEKAGEEEKESSRHKALSVHISELASYV
jgi:hypothetical protein